jgi:hypothetical protein
MNAYLKDMRVQFENNKLVRRQNLIVQALQTGPATPQILSAMESLDIQKTEIQRRCKSQCQKIKKPELAFSLPFRTIHKQREAFVHLQCWHKKKTTNSHIIRDAYKAGIPNPMQLTVAKCIVGAAACRRCLKEPEARADKLRREHLGTKYELARTLKNSKRRKEIEAVIKQEDLQSWSAIQCATGERWMGANLRFRKMLTENWSMYSRPQK